MIKTIAKPLQSALGLAVLILGSPLSLAADDSAFVRQIGEERRIPVDQARQIANFSSPGQGVINNIDTARLNDALPSLPGAGKSSSEIVQRGTRNRAIVSIQGSNNATLQRQRGVALDSSVSVVGTGNAVLVDQKGANLDSEVGILGANKRIVHIQRGRGTNPDSSPLQLTGTKQETQLILETPKGRVTKTLP